MTTLPAAIPGVPTTRIFVGDVLRLLATLPAKSVHGIVTSPPYFGLRDYGLPPSVWGGETNCHHEWGDVQRGPWANDVPGPNSGGLNASFRNQTKTAGSFCAKCGAWRGCLGLEPTVEMYLEHLVAVFRECWRVLRDDGILWLNIGDSYAGSGRGPTGHNGIGQHERRQGFHSPGAAGGVRAKSLMMVPERLVLALQADGWIVRDRVVWHKTSTMPENVRDRCTDAWEPVYQLTKRGRYYADMEAVKQPAIQAGRERTDRVGGNKYTGATSMHSDGAVFTGAATANLRNVWSLGPEPFGEAHFATFPTELPRRCIQISTSERGVCPTCGTPWARVTSSRFVPQEDVTAARVAFRGKGEAADDSTGNVAQANWVGTPRGTKHTVTLGWKPGCACPPHDPVPATVLDPFGGALTTALVANQLGRDSISIELNPEYVAMGVRRIQADAGMLCDITVIEEPAP